MSSRSMTDVAYDLMRKKKKEIPFSKLWQEVSQNLGFSESQANNKIASFYSALMLDNRFTSMKDNKWDLRSRHTFSETHVDTSAIVIEDDIVKDEEEQELFREDEEEEASEEFEGETEEDEVY